MKTSSKFRDLEEDHIDEEGSWAISYGDMITVLMSFFILYFSMDPKAHKEKQITESLVAALSKQEDLQKKSMPNFPSNLRLGEELDGNSVDKKVINILGARLTKMGVKLIVEFPHLSFFNSGRIDIRPEAHEALKLFVEKYLPYSGNFVLGVQAYTDKKQVRNFEGRRFRDNLELSALRSVAAMRVLQSHGISIKNMRLSGFGEYKKVYKKLQSHLADKNDISFSRKVVLVIEPKDEELTDESV